MIRRWWRSLQTGSLQAKQRELRAVQSDLDWLLREWGRLAERRDEIVVELRET